MKYIHPLLLCCLFFILPLAFWLGHYKPFVSLKDFLFFSIVIIAFALLLAQFIIQGKLPIRSQRIYLAVGAFFLYVTVSYLFHPYTDGHYLSLLFACFMLFFIVAYTVSLPWRDKIVVSLCVASIIMGLYSVVQFLGYDIGAFIGHFDTRLEFGSRTFATLGNPNLLGGFSVFMLPLLIAYALRAHATKDKLMWLFIAGIFFSCISLITSQTRGSWIAAILAMLLFLVLYLRKYVVAKRYIYGVASIAFLLLLTLGLFYLVSSNTALVRSDTAQVRLFYYTNTIDMISDAPLFGRGIGTFDVYYPLYQDKRRAFELGERSMEFRVEHPHNEHLEILSDLGIFGYLIFLWIIVEALILLFRRKDIVSIGIGAAILGLLVDGFMSQNLRFVSIFSLLWLALGFSTISLSSHSFKKPYLTSLYARAVPVCLFLLIALLPISGAYATMKADEHIRNGLGLYIAGNYELAAFELDAALAYDPSNYRGLYYAGASYRLLGNVDRALHYYRELLALNPHFLQTNYHIGVLLIHQGAYAEAKPYLQRQIRLNAMYWQAYYALAAVERELGDSFHALSLLDSIDRINAIARISSEEYAPVQRLRAQLYLDVDDIDAAIAVLETLPETESQIAQLQALQNT